MNEEFRSGLASAHAATRLLQRIRNAHPTKGLYQAAELEFWWSVPRTTDTYDQLYWFDEAGPVAAVLMNDFGDGSSLVYSSPVFSILVMPDITAEFLAHIVDRALAHAAANGIEAIEMEVERTDQVMRDLAFERGFTDQGEALIECWLAADARPAVSALHEGYQLLSRAETAANGQPHHLAAPHRPNVEERLNQTTLYRPDLDLVVLDRQAETAGYGLFWYDPVTATGVVEPMRTHEEHRKKGLARHILTEGIERLVQAGAERISIGFEPDNPASSHLYLDVGFVPNQHTDMFAGPTLL